MVVIECGEFDKYGRLLGKIYLKQENDGQSGGGESVSINDWLVQNKYAFPYDGGKKQDWGKYLLEQHQVSGIQ